MSGGERRIIGLIGPTHGIIGLFRVLVRKKKENQKIPFFLWFPAVGSFFEADQVFTVYMFFAKCVTLFVL